MAGHAASETLFTSVPLVAVTMGLEAALLDWLLFRVVMKKSVKGRAVWVLVANLLNASIALALSLAWVVCHPTIMIAVANGLPLKLNLT